MARILLAPWNQLTSVRGIPSESKAMAAGITPGALLSTRLHAPELEPADMPETELSRIIDAAWDDRANVSTTTPGPVREAVEEALSLLDSGKARVAEKARAEWRVNQWLKKAVLLSFRLNDM